MFHRVILAAALLTPVALSAAPSPNWSNIVHEPGFIVDIDESSVKAIIRNNGFEMLTRLKMNFEKPFIIPGKKKLGAYYVNEIAAKCKGDTFDVEKSTVYSSDGEVLTVGNNVASIKNPKNPKSFITIWLQLTCNQFAGKQPPTII